MSECPDCGTGTIIVHEGHSLEHRTCPACPWSKPRDCDHDMTHVETRPHQTGHPGLDERYQWAEYHCTVDGCNGARVVREERTRPLDAYGGGVSG